MPLFRCEKCSCLENTAVSHYHTRPKGAPALCSECDPEIGRWHGRFEKKPVGSEYVEDERGYLITHEDKARWEAAENAAKSVSAVKHIGLEGMVKYFFGAGWNAAMRWQKEQQGK